MSKEMNSSTFYAFLTLPPQYLCLLYFHTTGNDQAYIKDISINSPYFPFYLDTDIEERIEKGARSIHTLPVNDTLNPLFTHPLTSSQHSCTAGEREHEWHLPYTGIPERHLPFGKAEQNLLPLCSGQKVETRKLNMKRQALGFMSERNVAYVLNSNNQ